MKEVVCCGRLPSYGLSGSGNEARMADGQLAGNASFEDV